MNNLEEYYDRRKNDYSKILHLIQLLVVKDFV